MKHFRRLLIPILAISLLGGVVLARADEAEKKPEEGRLPIPYLVGSWTITYHPNKAVRTYTITERGAVFFAEEHLQGQITKEGNTLLLWFPAEEGKLERLTLGSDGRLFVEHYDPKTGYPDNPAQIGTGVPRE